MLIDLKKKMILYLIVKTEEIESLFELFNEATILTQGKSYLQFLL